MKVLFLFLAVSLTGCTAGSAGVAVDESVVIDPTSVNPGTQVNIGDKKVDLFAGNLKVGDNLHKIASKAGLNFPQGITLVNVVPSIDTPVCEAQTHILGEDKSINSAIKRINISRDLPMAQSRFAKAAQLENIQYLSDYKTGDFGKSTGLMMKGNHLLARGVIVTDAKGVIRYMQIVSDVRKLPDMQKAIRIANDLSKGVK